MPYKDEEEKRIKSKEQKARRRNYAKEKGLCVQCLKPIEENRAGKTICLVCTGKVAKWKADLREFYREIGICPKCGTNELFGDEKTCLECKAKDAEYKAKQRESEEMREQINAMHRKWAKENYAKRKEQGICTRCGKKAVDPGYVTCSWCRGKMRVKAEEKRAWGDEGNKERRIREGKCIWCENPVKQGFKICEYHYQMNIDKANSPKAVENRLKFKNEVLDKHYRLNLAKRGNKDV